MSTQLVFQDTVFNPVLHNGQYWFTSAELAQALEYKKADSVSQIYSRNSDEFTSSMTTTLNLRVVRKTGTVSMMVRVFSLRGAHLVSMFANTSVAKLFRKWVLDILDREVEKTSTVIQPPDSRYQVRVEIYDKHLKKTDTFYGVAGSYEKIISGIAKRYGYYVEKIISLPVGLF